MNDPSNSRTYLALAQNSPSLLLKGDTPRLIDEWQDAPELWDAARFEVDHRDTKTGQFIFTDSTVIPKEKLERIKHSGTGRAAWIKMRPMSLWESGESNGQLSLNDLFLNKTEAAYQSNELGIEQLAWLICRGLESESPLKNSHKDIRHPIFCRSFDSDRRYGNRTG